MPYTWTVLGEVVLAAGLLLGGLARRRPMRWIGLPGAFLLGTALAWSLAAPTATILAVALAACTLVGAVVLTPVTVRGPMLTFPLALVLAESVALPRYFGVSWPVTGLVLAAIASVLLLASAFLPRRLDTVLWPLQLVSIPAYLVGTALAATEWDSLAMTLGPGVLVALLTTTRAGGWQHRFWAVASDVLVCAEVAAVAAASGAEGSAIGFALGASAVVTATASIWISPAALPAGRIVSYVSAGIYAISIALVLGSPDWLSSLLFIGAVSAGGIAAHPARRIAGWLSGMLLALSTWVKLVDAGVTAPEAYAAPSGVALLIVGYVRFRREPHLSSWVVYGPGLSLVLLPSLGRAVTDPDLLRPLSLGLIALAAVLVGARWRLQAPLLLGGFTLATDALVQLAPYLTDLYAVVPRWVSIGVAGALVLSTGVTYEQRLRDLRRLRDAVTGMR